MNMFSKIGAITLILLSFVGTSASAQSANDYMRQQQATDPGYQSAVRGGYYHNSTGDGYYRGGSNGGNNGYDQPIVVQQESTCVLLVLFCTNRRPRNRTGDVCYDANGIAYGLDRQGRWYQLSGSTRAARAPSSVRNRCGWNSYEASGG